MRNTESIIGEQFNEWTVLKDLGNGKLECQCSCNNIKILNKYSVLHGKTKSCGCLRKFKPLKGQKFNHWTVIEDIDKDYALCECDCEEHTIRKVQKGHLKNGTSKSCGCNNKRSLENLVGQKFNYLTVIKELGDGKVEVECECHNTKIVEKYAVKNGIIKSCGCKSRELKAATTINKINETYNDWTIIEELGHGKVKARCSCNNICILQKASILNGTSKSCGHNTNMFVDLTGKIINNWEVIEELGYGKVKCRCLCKKHTIQILQKAAVVKGTSKSCGCQKTALMQNTLIEKYGDITANRIDNPREPWQIQVVINKENFEKYLKTFATKPTIKQLVDKLDICEAQVGRLIIKYGLGSHINYSPSHSYYEDELLKYIECIYNGKIEHNNRHIISPYELDICIPDKKIAIEFNGDFWHSSLYKSKNYHQQKTIACAKKGIHLIHVFEHEWIDKEVQKKLKSYLNMLLTDNKEVVFGRNTTASEITNTEANEFCNKYHLQGSINSRINIGILNKNKELLGVMTFGVPRFNNNNYEYEIYRMCFKDNTIVIGGVQKIFKYFINKYTPKSVLTYVDITKFTGNSYLDLGFKPITGKAITDPNYVWISLNGRFEVLSRYQTQKQKLIEAGLGTSEQTEVDIMESLNFIQVFDSGNLKLEWIDKK